MRKAKKQTAKKPTKSTAIVKHEQSVTVWNQADLIRKQFAPTLTESEFIMFVGLGKALGANPFTREIWAVKYRQDQPASIFCGRDFYRRKAQEQPDYDGHMVEAVYAKDQFEMLDGEPHHKFNMKERGALIGAYCIVRRKRVKQPYVVSVRLSEYNKGFSSWNTMPETMIKKVAEAQGLRGAFQGVFAGTYDESEIWKDDSVEKKSYQFEVEQKEPEKKPATPEELFNRAMTAIGKSKTPDEVFAIMSGIGKVKSFSEDQIAKLKSAANAKVDAINAEGAK